MYCPEHVIFSTRFMSVWFYDSFDRRWGRIPLSWKLNPFRYEVNFRICGNCFVINREGMMARNAYIKRKEATKEVKP